MSFVSLKFLLFAVIVLLAYYLVPGRFQWVVLLAASLYFYTTYGFALLFFLLTSTAVAYGAGLLISSTEDAEKKKAWMRGAVLLLVAILAGAKFSETLAKGLNAVFHGKPLFQALAVLGISYYSFSLISYVVDVARGTDRCEKNYFRLLLFSSFFPKVIQGPISRHNFLGSQLSEKHPFRYGEFCEGAQQILWGVFKKKVIADRLALLTGVFFGNPGQYSGAILLIAGVFYCFQLYCDFSGCMDIAEGFSLCLGIRLEKNFHHPFFSKSGAEFWRRWHITLGSWMKDYIYMPVAISPKFLRCTKSIRQKFGKRAGKSFANIIPLLCVWFTVGIWHGVNSSCIVWGLYWGFLIIFATVFSPELAKAKAFLRIDSDLPIWRFLNCLKTFVFFLFGEMITLTDSIGSSLALLKSSFSDFRLSTIQEALFVKNSFRGTSLLMSVLLIAGLMLFEGYEERNNDKVQSIIAKQPAVLRWVLWYALIFAVIFLGIHDPGTERFLYAQF